MGLIKRPVPTLQMPLSPMQRRLKLRKEVQTLNNLTYWSNKTGFKPFVRSEQLAIGEQTWVKFSLSQARATGRSFLETEMWMKAEHRQTQRLRDYLKCRILLQKSFWSCSDLCSL